MRKICLLIGSARLALKTAVAIGLTSGSEDRIRAVLVVRLGRAQ